MRSIVRSRYFYAALSCIALAVVGCAEPLEFGQVRGTVSLNGKWWSFPKDSAALGNMLTPAAWSVTGQPAYNDTFVEVEGAE